MLLYLLWFFVSVFICYGTLGTKRNTQKAAISAYMLALGLFVGFSDMLGGYDRYVYAELFDNMADVTRVGGNPWLSYSYAFYDSEFGYGSLCALLTFITGNRYAWQLGLQLYPYKTFLTDGFREGDPVHEKYEYDWLITDEEVCYDTKRVYPCTILTYHPLEDKKQPIVQRRILRWFLSKNYQQIHVYSNMLSGDNEYSQLFHELFRPATVLKEQIDYHLGKLGGKKNYSAVVFRFRQLLGDFKEGGETLPEAEREPYIEQCISAVDDIHHQSPEEKILVTSDSTTFLQKLSSLPYVYTIPGEVVHIGFTYDASKKTYMKSFVDYYMLSYAKRVTLARDDKLFHSGFALRAAMLNGAEYQETWI